MSDVLGTSIGVFLGLTVGLFGLSAWLTGRALAETWRARWKVLPASLLLTLGDRFLAFALFGAPLLSIYGLLAAALVLWLIADTAYRNARARLMVSQYPWLYRRHGLFGWRSLEHS